MLSLTGTSDCLNVARLVHYGELKDRLIDEWLSPPLRVLSENRWDEYEEIRRTGILTCSIPGVLISELSRT